MADEHIDGDDGRAAANPAVDPVAAAEGPVLGSQDVAPLEFWAVCRAGINGNWMTS